MRCPRQVGLQFIVAHVQGLRIEYIHDFVYPVHQVEDTGTRNYRFSLVKRKLYAFTVIIVLVSSIPNMNA